MTYGSMFATQVRKLLVDHGYDLTFRRVAHSAYDPSTGSATAGANSDETVRGAFLDYEEEEFAEEPIQRGDRKLLVSAVDSSGSAITKEPEIDDLFIGEGNQVTVVNSRKVKNGATIVAYICQVRAA